MLLPCEAAGRTPGGGARRGAPGASQCTTGLKGMVSGPPIVAPWPRVRMCIGAGRVAVGVGVDHDLLLGLPKAARVPVGVGMAVGVLAGHHLGRRLLAELAAVLALVRGVLLQMASCHLKLPLMHLAHSIGVPRRISIRSVH